ncbi:MAG: hypothetical protein Q8O92_05925, partial [Candidatus Latescibacter sp.]|nr:hypothetical protein [Candidatus Latescibacter sp.]
AARAGHVALYRPASTADMGARRPEPGLPFTPGSHRSRKQHPHDPVRRNRGRALSVAASSWRCHALLGAGRPFRHRGRDDGDGKWNLPN